VASTTVKRSRFVAQTSERGSIASALQGIHGRLGNAKSGHLAQSVVQPLTAAAQT
jgi:hypothetical protein